ncbi:thiamine pyrophosphate-dependent enzyme [Akkermansiaceae bacterium]|nr:thiamine pyrophosphate-dependent enzyme [Akkermansiaceae bacterium]
MDLERIGEIIRIRCVEMKFLELFSAGLMNGTVHTCIGQELSAMAFAGQLNQEDFVFSNHRCHGHYLAYTKDWKGLMLELMGKKEGVCGGIGSSQHLQKNNFFSNGIQGGIVPLAAGFAFGNKKIGNDQIGVVYIGDGTLGEGVVYESLNFISKHQIPIIVVCENNQYAQSTPSSETLAGSIEGRAKAFGLEFRKSNTFDGNTDIFEEAQESLDYVRNTGNPLFHQIDTYRLKAHSKGDDDRDQSEIKDYEARDFLLFFQKQNPEQFAKLYSQIQSEINIFVDEVTDNKEQSIGDYLLPPSKEVTLRKKESFEDFSKQRLVTRINEALKTQLADNKTLLIGEDILDPYGGAFKITKGLSDQFPDQVVGTPISEALIAGLSNGLALRGFNPIAEFMFGDFMTLGFDQMLNHAAKFHNMYNKKLNCGVIFRTPMGGGRGYGPTHSQSIEKHFIGMETFTILAINKLLSPDVIYSYARSRKDPTIVIENKVEYGKTGKLKLPRDYKCNLLKTDTVPILLVEPEEAVDTAIICYGGYIDEAVEAVEQLIIEGDLIPKIIIVSQIDPFQEEIKILTETCDTIIFIEEGIDGGTVGDYFISKISQEKSNINFKNLSSKRIAIPSARSLEKKMMAKMELSKIIKH